MRSENVVVRVSRTELRDWKQCAKASHMSLSEWLRHIANGRPIFETTVAWPDSDQGKDPTP